MLENSIKKKKNVWEKMSYVGKSDVIVQEIGKNDVT